MKFLVALSILVTSTAFAQSNFKRIKCYEPAQQNGRGELAYVIEQRGESLHVIYPDDITNGNLLQRGDCLEHGGFGEGPEITQPPKKLQLCLSDAQRTRTLVAVDATVEGEDSDLIYCEKSILRLFEDNLTF